MSGNEKAPSAEDRKELGNGSRAGRIVALYDESGSAQLPGLEDRKENPPLSNRRILGQKCTWSPSGESSSAPSVYITDYIIDGYGVVYQDQDCKLLSCGLPYAYPIICSDSGCVASVDMVRHELNFIGEKDGTAANEGAAKVVTPGYNYFECRNRPGLYRFLHVYSFGESSLSLGIGLHDATGKCNMNKGFVEWNPNKVPLEDVKRVAVFLSPFVHKVTPKRFDLAFDIPQQRSDFCLFKDRRKYRADVDKSLTEYLGRRNADGYVKVYDKQAEAKLDTPVTRIEVTTDWEAEKCKFPIVCRACGGDFEGLSGAYRALAVCAFNSVQFGVPFEVSLAAVSERRTRLRIRKAVENSMPQVVLPQGVEELARMYIRELAQVFGTVRD